MAKEVGGAGKGIRWRRSADRRTIRRDVRGFTRVAITCAPVISNRRNPFGSE